MNNLLKQGELLPVATIAERITGERPSRPTMWRWLHRGVSGGIRLEAVTVLNGWRTTEAAFHDFLARRSAAKLAPRDLAPPPTDDNLRAAGLL